MIFLSDSLFDYDLCVHGAEMDMKNSKVFGQKGDLLNFKANIDPMGVLSRVKPGRAELS